MGNTTSQSTTAAEPYLAWEVDVDIDGEAEAFLGEDPLAQHKNTPEEEKIPREIIANLKNVRRTHFQARLNRPIIVGTYRELPAYLLCCQFTFQRTCDTWLSRIRGATITIEFEDAPRKYDGPAGNDPSVVKFYPAEEPFVGRTSHGTSTLGVGISASVGSTLPLNVGVAYTKPVESAMVISGTCSGKRRQIVEWSLKENEVSNSGMPRLVIFPLILISQEKRRFAVKLRASMAYAWGSGVLGNSVPLVGKNVEPVYFEPLVLDQLAKHEVPSTLGRGPIATVFRHGPLEDINLEEYSKISMC